MLTVVSSNDTRIRFVHLSNCRNLMHNCIHILHVMAWSTLVGVK